ncbi:hypothetical protein JW930_06200 [Candidatus Woesearchaeota archaeon]|nr:hypothetical protein [Candidatus Woesearchaeota archaeon]
MTTMNKRTTIILVLVGLMIIPYSLAFVCGNYICEQGEYNYCPLCYYSYPPCDEPCYEGTCPGDCECNCITLWDPVCGVDENTYGNACIAECYGVEIAYEGECQECVLPVCPLGPGDCNDDNYFINPGVQENCDNGVDDDCDGYIDCHDSSCYDSPLCIGHECSDELCTEYDCIKCEDYGDCTKEQCEVADIEQCDGIDNDNNGLCYYYDGTWGDLCYLYGDECADNGICVMVDEGNEPDECKGTCEDLNVEWTSRPGTAACCGDDEPIYVDNIDYGEDLPFIALTSDEKPYCDEAYFNGNDNDCDTQITVDEGCPCYPVLSTRKCGTNIGECEYGVQTCLDDGDNDQNGYWSECEGGIAPIPELCGEDGLGDGKDNDCDGRTDEGCSAVPVIPCEEDEECVDKLICITAIGYDTPICCDNFCICGGTESYQYEYTCSDEFDNDCDSYTDCFDSSCYNAPNCLNKHLCSDGVCEDYDCDYCEDYGDCDASYCEGGGGGGGGGRRKTRECDYDKDGYRKEICGGDDCNDNNPNIHPGAQEICNGVDDDCDGKVDEGCFTPPQLQEDKDGDGYYPPDDCDDNDPKVHPGAKELCNNKDDDCDGLVDEDLNCQYDIALNLKPVSKPRILDIFQGELTIKNNADFDIYDFDIRLLVPEDWEYKGDSKVNVLKAGQSQTLAFDILIPDYNEESATITLVAVFKNADNAEKDAPISVLIPEFLVAPEPSFNEYDDKLKRGTYSIDFYYVLNNQDTKALTKLDIEFNVNYEGLTISTPIADYLTGINVAPGEIVVKPMPSNPYKIYTSATYDVVGYLYQPPSEIFKPIMVLRESHEQLELK